MLYNRLGISGLKVSQLSFGTWLTFDNLKNIKNTTACLRLALESGINLIDTAESYGGGIAESILGKALKGVRREDLVISTKLFSGGFGPNEQGLSRKHLTEGLQTSLKRLKMEYVDILLCHRPDPDTTLFEIVSTMDGFIRKGLVFYWGTSTWPVNQIIEAYQIAEQYRFIPPALEQPQYNLLYRNRVENEYKPLYKKFGHGIVTWSPLASGILCGKYRNGIPKGSRLDKIDKLKKKLTPGTAQQIDQICRLAKSLGCTPAQLAIAWCLKNKNVNSVILGASSKKQLLENLGAQHIISQLENDTLKKIDSIVND